MLRKKHLNGFKCFLRGQKGETTPPPKKIEVLAPDTLVSILQYFFAEINKKDGNYYEASSLAAKFGCSTD